MKFSLLGERVAICAKTGGGKSYLLKYLLSIEAKKFSKIFCISPTEPLNKFYSDIIPANCIHDTFSEKWLMQLIKKAMEYKKNPDNKPKHILLILDDVGDLIHESKALEIIAIKGRHFHVNFVILAQYINMIPPCVRNQIGVMCVGQQNSASTHLLHEYFNSSHLNRQEFEKLYRSCSTDHNFFLINCNSAEQNDDLDQLFGKIRAPPNV